MGKDDEIALDGGTVAAAVRVGDTVRRPVERWTAAAHGVLRHLETIGFDGAPRVLGIDEVGREMLTWIPGTAATRPWPPQLCEDEGLARLGVLLRSYHDAIRTYTPSADTEWWTGEQTVADEDIVLHGDPGPWNTIWQNGVPVAFVDFDFVAPGPPIRDLGYAAYFAVPMSDDAHCAACGFTTPPDRARRLRTFLDAYGWTGRPDHVVDQVVKHWTNEADQIEELGPKGIKPWAGFLERGLHLEDRQIVAWLTANRELLTQ